MQLPSVLIPVLGVKLCILFWIFLVFLFLKCNSIYMQYMIHWCTFSFVAKNIEIFLHRELGFLHNQCSFYFVNICTCNICFEQYFMYMHKKCTYIDWTGSRRNAYVSHLHTCDIQHEYSWTLVSGTSILIHVEANWKSLRHFLSIFYPQNLASSRSRGLTMWNYCQYFNM